MDHFLPLRFMMNSRLASSETPLFRPEDHPFLGGQASMITVGSPALYPAREPRRLGCCESSGGRPSLQEAMRPGERSLLVGPLFLPYMPNNLAQTPRQILVLVAGTWLAFWGWRLFFPELANTLVILCVYYPALFFVLKRASDDVSVRSVVPAHNGGS